MTNLEFSKTDDVFKKACADVRHVDNKGNKGPIIPSARQASKWRMGKGIAYKTWKGIA